MACGARSGLKRALVHTIAFLFAVAKWPVEPVRVSYENSGNGVGTEQDTRS